MPFMNCLGFQSVIYITKDMETYDVQRFPSYLINQLMLLPLYFFCWGRPLFRQLCAPGADRFPRR